jgi:transcriptional regulator with XRE-family HTH domain
MSPSKHIEQNSSTKFGLKLQADRETTGLSQVALAQKAKITRVAISGYERGKSSPGPELAIQIAKLVGGDEAEYLLLSLLQRQAGPELLKVVSRLLGSCRSSLIGLERKGPQGYLSLVDFPGAFDPIVVVVGDKREEIPQNPGDLFLYSASTVDDRWIASLGLSRNTEKISDKVLMTAMGDDRWLKKKFGNTHILCIGSPATNLFAREYNNCFLFRFAISREAEKKWVERRRDISQARTPAELLHKQQEYKYDLKQTMRMFKAPGFLDFHYKHLKLGIDQSYNTDFAVISLGRNPFADQDKPYFAILAGGCHHPGTAFSIRQLSDPGNFLKHPFGGILEVEVPSKQYAPQDVFWHERIEKSEVHWHSTGSDDLNYTPTQLRERLVELSSSEDMFNFIDVALEKEEIKQHIALIDRLAAATKPVPIGT